MKTLFLTILLSLLLQSITFAQTEKGRLLLGITGSEGGLNFLNNNQNDLKSFSFNVNPTIGIFVKGNFLIGGTLGANYIRQKDTSLDYKRTDIGLRIGPVLRYYFPGENSRFYLNLNTSYGFGQSKNEEGSSNFKDKFGSYNLEGGVGIAFFINEKLSIDLLAGLGFTSNKFDSDTERTSGTGIGLRLGFSFFK